jgi:putative oxidoreductase
MLLTWLISFALASFFIYKGLNKHWLNPCKAYPADSPIPIDYINVINAFCHSGFLKMIGGFQILSGILLLIPRTRLAGAVLLFPIIFNIFMIHFFLDNRPEELVESGIPLLGNALLLILLANQWKVLFAKG